MPALPARNPRTAAWIRRNARKRPDYPLIFATASARIIHKSARIIRKSTRISDKSARIIRKSARISDKSAGILHKSRLGFEKIMTNAKKRKWAVTLLMRPQKLTELWTDSVPELLFALH